MIRKGRDDRNSYYHELFLRGKPYLVKQMRRPHPNMKPIPDANTEPDFAPISEERPLPDIKQEAEEGGNYEAEAKGILAHCAYIEQRQVYSGKLITDDQKVPETTRSGGAPLLEPLRAFKSLPDILHETGDGNFKNTTDFAGKKRPSFEATEGPVFHPSAWIQVPQSSNIVNHSSQGYKRFDASPGDTLFPENVCLQGFDDAILEGLSPKDDSFWLM
jgi:hypothetical protein